MITYIKNKISRFIVVLNYFSIQNKIRQSFKSTSIYFFFPSYHIGGADKVHLEIVKAAALKYSITTLIVHKSKSENFKKDFEFASNSFIDIGVLGNYRFLRKIFISRISKRLNAVDKPVTIFGCNNNMFYDIVDSVTNPLVRKVDLLHAFSPYINGTENRSIHSASKLDARVVINKLTKESYITQYKNHNLPESLIEKISIIYNKINWEIEDRKRCMISDKIKCLWVGRNSPEKRPELYEKIAQEILKRDKTFQFSMVGNFEKNIEHINYLGEISQEHVIEKIYELHNVLMTTSVFEGFPLTISEAMSKGLVNISTDVGGINEHVNTNNGILIPNQTDDNLIVQEFVESILNLKKDITNFQKLSDNAFDYAKKHFTNNEFEKKYIEVLNPTISNNNR